MLSKMKTDFSYQPVKVDAVRAQQLRAEIEAFHIEYCAVLDACDVKKWPEFFTEDGVYRVTSRENANQKMLVGLVYAEGRGMMHDRAVAIAQTQMFAPRHIMHMVSNIRIMDESDEFIEAETNYLLIQTLIEGPSTIHLAGKYYDRFVRSENGLLLKERQVVYDTEILATDLVYPV